MNPCTALPRPSPAGPISSVHRPTWDNSVRYLASGVKKTDVVGVLEEVLEHADGLLQSWRVVRADAREGFNTPERTKAKCAFFSADLSQSI